MNGTNGNQNDYPENALVPYPVILAASKGDPDAMKMVLQHFSGYIASLSMRKLYDERGNVYYGVDEDIRERLQARLMRASHRHRNHTSCRIFCCWSKNCCTKIWSCKKCCSWWKIWKGDVPSNRQSPYPLLACSRP